MRILSDLLTRDPYSLNKSEKKRSLDFILSDLSMYHRDHCLAYSKILDLYDLDEIAYSNLEDLPFLPVRLFKEFELLSIPKEAIAKTMMSSGTTGQAVSKIHLDRETSINQQKVLAKIVSDFIGSQRLPMLIIDSPSVLKNRDMFSARGAGILGFSIFGSKTFYALDESMKLNLDGIRTFLETHAGYPILIFGFTSMIWQHFYKDLIETKNSLDISNGIVIHGGGWKKLQSEAIDKQQFKKCLESVCGVTRVHDYYGMVEQTGSIYMECENGNLHTSIFSEVIPRRYTDLSICDIGEKGILEVASVLPRSYPGHLLLTEDEGTILGEDDCPCGRLGKYFRIDGRLKNAEIRGCSDTYAAGFKQNR